MATAITQNNGSNITGFSAPVSVDKGFQRKSDPKIHAISFGDGYEQRLADGLNNLSQTMGSIKSARFNTLTDTTLY